MPIAVKMRSTMAAGLIRMPMAINTAAALSSTAPATKSNVANGTPDLASHEAATSAKGPGKSESFELIIAAVAAGSINLNSADMRNVMTTAIRPIVKRTRDTPDERFDESINDDDMFTAAGMSLNSM